MNFCSFYIVFATFLHVTNEIQDIKILSNLKKIKSKIKEKKKVSQKDDLDLLVKKSFTTTHNAFSRLAGSGVELNCETKVTRRILRSHPRAPYRWFHNDVPLKLEPARMVFQMGDLVIQGLKSQDTGLYVCQLKYKPKKFSTVGIFSVLVRSDFVDEIKVVIGRTIPLQCNSGPLGLLYPHSKRTWYHDNQTTVAKNILAEVTKEDEIREAKISMSGVWKCVVKDNVTGNTWETAIYRVKVVPPPTGIYFYVDYFQHNTRNAVFLVVGVACVLVALSSIVIDKVEKKKKREQEEMEFYKYQLLQMQEDDEHRTIGTYDRYGDDVPEEGFVEKIIGKIEGQEDHDESI